jgi:hypothetical protein
VGISIKKKKRNHTFPQKKNLAQDKKPNNNYMNPNSIPLLHIFYFQINNPNKKNLIKLSITGI